MSINKVNEGGIGRIALIEVLSNSHTSTSSVSYSDKGLAADLHSQTLALPRVMSLAVFLIFYFVLFIDIFFV